MNLNDIFTFSDKTYDIINKLQRWFYALGALYLGLAKIWPLPYGPEINDTIILIGTFLAATLEVSTYNYKKRKEGEDESLG